MNELADKYGGNLAVLGFPCNQFGHQSSVNNAEFLNFLKYVRPGKGFEPAQGVTIFEKCQVNGRNAAPAFKWMKSELVLPSDGQQDTQQNGCADFDALILPQERAAVLEGHEDSGMSLWMPVCRSDIAWNFEKFLFDQEGRPVKRYTRFFDTSAIAADIDKLLD